MPKTLDSYLADSVLTRQLYLMRFSAGEKKKVLDGIEDIPQSEELVLVPSPSVFMPSPHTAMEYDAIHYERDYIIKWRTLFRGAGINGKTDKPWKFQSQMELGV